MNKASEMANTRPDARLGKRMSEKMSSLGVEGQFGFETKCTGLESRGEGSVPTQAVAWAALGVGLPT